MPAPRATAPVAYLHHPASLGHDTGAHPERGARIVAVERELERRGWPGLRRVLAPAAAAEALTAVHPEAHVSALRALSERGGGFVDADTVVSSGSYEAALRAAGAAAHMVDLLLAGGGEGDGWRPPAAFCALRPPGHHAETARAMGFCLFNNVAVAARRARDAHGCARVLIFDWDVHHGNGTSQVFWSDPGVLFVSIHQWPLYPGSGHAGEEGGGEALGHTVNLPVPAGSGDAEFRSAVHHVVLPLIEAFVPELVLVSAGYDAHVEDPLASCRVGDAGYRAMSAVLRRACAARRVPLGMVLEGGYAVDALARAVALTLEALVDDDPLVPDEPEPTPISRAAVGRLKRFWPGLAS